MTLSSQPHSYVFVHIFVVANDDVVVVVVVNNVVGVYFVIVFDYVFVCIDEEAVHFALVFLKVIIEGVTRWWSKMKVILYFYQIYLMKKKYFSW